MHPASAPRPSPQRTDASVAVVSTAGETEARGGKGQGGVSLPPCRQASERVIQGHHSCRRGKNGNPFGFWSGPASITTRLCEEGRAGVGAAGASLIHELLAEAPSQGKIDDLLQVLVGGFIKLSAAGCKSDEYSRFRLGSNSPALAITRWMHRRKAGTVALGAPGARKQAPSTGAAQIRSSASAWEPGQFQRGEGGDEIVDPKPTCRP